MEHHKLIKILIMQMFNGFIYIQIMHNLETFNEV